MARSSLEESKTVFVMSIITTYTYATEVAQWADPSSLPQPATDNGVTDDRLNWLAFTPPPIYLAVTPERHNCTVQLSATNLTVTVGNQTRVLKQTPDESALPS